MQNERIIWKRAADLGEQDLTACALLFNEHYGQWGTYAPQDLVGKKIKLKGERLRTQYLRAPDSWATLAQLNDQLIGYVFSQRLSLGVKGHITWVTQFVVHQEHRNLGLGTRLLRAIWSQSDQYAWGLVTANPFAVRALENATLRHCDLARITAEWPTLYDAAKPYLDYVAVGGKTMRDASTALNTQFPVSHTESDKAVGILERNGYQWILGDIGGTEEWVAFTFQDQPFSADSEKLVAGWIEDCERTVMTAYGSMTLDASHKWTKYAESEIDFFVAEAKPKSDAAILDIGCGAGRHSIELAKRGYYVTGIDFGPRLIDAAASAAETRSVSNNTHFICCDARNWRLDSRFDHALCLYDVIGSFAADQENRKILETAYFHLKPGGVLLASAMNGELTAHLARHRTDSEHLPMELLKLRPSGTMQSTGGIFDPDYYLWDETAGVTYRREKFEGITIAPCELIVRDRRYTATSISKMCEEVGFKVLKTRYAQIGKWNFDLQPTEISAKEIVVVCQKPM